MVSRNAENPETPVRCLQTRPSLRRCGIFYTAMAFVAFLLSLGMNFTPIHTEDLGVYRIIAWLSPYHLLYKFVPGFSIIRSPARFSIFLALFLAILSGVGMLWVYRRIRPRWRWGLIPLLISITIFELWPAPLRFVKVAGAVDELPPIYQQMRKLPPETVLIEFPLTLSPSEQGKEASARQMYFSTFYWYRLVDGYSSFAPKAHADLVNVLRRSDIAPALSALGAFGVDYVVAHWDEMNAQEKRLLRRLEESGALIPIAHDGEQETLYEIETPQAEATHPLPLTIERLTMYESKRDAQTVTVSFSYEMAKDQTLLITPWQNAMSCEISWYKAGEDAEADSPPVLVKQADYLGSQLLHWGANEITLEMPAPAPGKYRVLVKHQLLSQSVTKTGFCEISPYGFVQFHEEL